ncbi:MAG: hypothetical protein HQK53_02785 [Oligoflexia bacterium]|nr:hypothetical protein [Oligoflexia bacterium]
MKNYFLNLLDEQISFQFTGRINVISKNDSLLLGTILFSNGELIYAKFCNYLGINALIQTLLAEVEHNNLTYAIEPELIDNISRNIGEELGKNSTCSSTIIDFLSKHLYEIEEDLKKRPPMDQRLAITKDFIWNGEKITPSEFDLLCIISDFGLIKDIYDNSPFISYETTQILLSLKNKNALYTIM